MNIFDKFKIANNSSVALISESRTMRYTELHQSVTKLATDIKYLNPRCIALYLDNCTEWVIADLAAHLCEVPIVPLPTFFSQPQLTHMIEDVDADLLITHQNLNSQPILSLFQPQAVENNDNGFEIYQRNISSNTHYPSGLAKITYTSGSTGSPKGVCHSAQAQLDVANSLSTVLLPLSIKRHLCTLPLSTLLENIAGVWAPLSIGASVALPSLTELGYGGASDLNPQLFLSTIAKYDPESIILVPELLNVLVASYEAGFPRLTNLKFIAVGGAKVSQSLLERANKLKLPVYEGYGLSEGCSVTTLNRPGQNKSGTSGQALPHIKISISSENEIEVSGSNMLGYLHEDIEMPEFYKTGDLGEIDSEGFITIHGRKKNMFITSFGRQVNPEWVESTLLEHDEIIQAAVYGESLPFNIAVIVLSDHDSDNISIEELIEHSNESLPHYAKVSQYIIADTPFSFDTGTLTANGKVKRSKVYEIYTDNIRELTNSNELYSSNVATA